MFEPPTETPDLSFQELYEHFYPRVVILFLRRGLSHEQSRDLAQDTFLRVYRGMQHFEGRSSPETWIRQIANNTFANWVRARRSQKRGAQEVSLETAWENGEPVFEEQGDLLPSRRPDVLTSMVERERRAEFRAALQELPPRMLQCVTLRLVHGLKYREIAERLGVSVNTVKAHFFQARKILRKRLGVDLPLARPGTGENDDE